MGYNPIRPNDRAVLTSQDYYNLEDTGIFNPYNPGIDEQKVNELEERFPGITQSLGQFAELGLRLYEETGLLVDTSGLNNVVMAKRNGQSQLTCLDGTPAFINKQSVVDRLIGQMTELRQIPGS